MGAGDYQDNSNHRGSDSRYATHDDILNAARPFYEKIFEEMNSQEVLLNHKHLFPQSSKTLDLTGLLSNTTLLILDFEGTISNDDDGKRDNLKGLLRYCRKSKIYTALSTDCPGKFLEEKFEEKIVRLVRHYLDAMCRRDVPSNHILTYSREDALFPLKVKNLGVLLEKFKTPRENTLMIGDGLADLVSAQVFGVHYYILHRTADFDFAKLIPNGNGKVHSEEKNETPLPEKVN